MRLRVAEEARAELQAARRRYAREANTRIAARFLAEFHRVATIAQRDPERWPEIDVGVRRVLFRDRFPYSLVYIVRESSVIVIAVMHQHREPGYWRGRAGV